MAAKWHFVEQSQSAKVRNPVQGEFFASEAIEGPAEALVREGIQNAVDACRLLPDGTPEWPARVRIFLSGPDGAVAAAQLEPFGVGLWHHVQAAHNGLRTPPSEGNSCPFLTFEDFGTTGLVGDITQWQPTPGVKNSFFYFFRAEGLTDKTDGKGGSWGVGKYVFPRSSRANVILALTKRADDGKKLVMGSITLKTRELAGSWYTPDGWFGERSSANELVMPSSDEALVRTIESTFSLQRGHEPGLSIMVPWPDPEITFQAILAGVVRGWFHAILSGRLIVEIATPAESLTLDGGNLLKAIERCDSGTRTEMEPLIRLAFYYCVARDQAPGPILLSPPDPEKAPKWSQDMLSDDLRKRLSKDLASGKPLTVRVPIAVRFKSGARDTSHFDIALVRDDAVTAGRVTFLRDSIIIPEVKHLRARGVRALVVADHRQLANLLRDAEHPAHTHWNKDTSTFKEKYECGPSYLSFVQNAVARLVEIVDAGQPDEDRTLLVDYFSVSAPPEDVDDVRATRKRKKPDRPEEPITPPAGVPRAVAVSKVSGGFTVTRGAAAKRTPKLIRVRVAYDCRHRNPLTRWHKADFHFGKDGGIVIEDGATGIEVGECIENRLLIAVNDPDFAFTVRGFDENRDILVRVDPEFGNDDQAD